MSSCWLKSLEIENFRNIKYSNLIFTDKVNIITGENGQGKTNLLEAIWLLTGAKSFKGAKDKDLINFNCDFSRINADVFDDDNIKKIEMIIAFTAEKKGRFAKINSSQQKKAVSLAGKFYCVVFSPLHLSLISGSPSLRRKFIDGALCQLYPNYIKIYKTFERYIDQKNSILKNLSKYSNLELKETLDVFNRHIGDLGYEIYLKRKEYISLITKYACEYYNQISNNKETISFEYLSFAKEKEDFYNFLNDSIEKDKKAGFSTCGVQREDIEIRINGDLAKDFASQGQQRSIVLSMKLAESDILKDITLSQPIILLDDVLSELDYSRQEYLLKHIDDKQVFISCCDEERISLEKSNRYYVKSGEIRLCT